jgi:hypothetical protein
MVAIDRHSSALRVPALASPKLYGTEQSHDGHAVCLTTCLMRSRTWCLAKISSGGCEAAGGVNGLVFR